MSRHRRQQRKRARRGPKRTLADFGVELNFGTGTFLNGVEHRLGLSAFCSAVTRVSDAFARLEFNIERRIAQGPIVIPDGVHAIAGRLETAVVKI